MLKHGGASLSLFSLFTKLRIMGSLGDIELLVASTNPGKVKEIRSSLNNWVDLKDLNAIAGSIELPETSGSIHGNAAQKAMACWQITGINCLADDSGLEVNALDGRPGVDSAFFAGHPRSDDRNMVYLLDQMEGVVDRSASFVTVMALVIDGELFLFEGRINGTITNRCQGTGGFGYDPVFVPEGENRTFAEMSIEEKNKISHRAKALAQVKSFLEKMHPGGAAD